MVILSNSLFQPYWDITGTPFLHPTGQTHRCENKSKSKLLTEFTVSMKKPGCDIDELNFILSGVPRSLLSSLKRWWIIYFLHFADWSRFLLLGSAECEWMLVTPFTPDISMWPVSWCYILIRQNTFIASRIQSDWPDLIWRWSDSHYDWIATGVNDICAVWPRRYFKRSSAV